MTEHINRDFPFQDLGEKVSYLRECDGIHSEYGSTKNVFPRTMNEAFGMYAELDVPDNSLLSKADKKMLYWVFLIIVIFLITYVPPTDIVK